MNASTQPVLLQFTEPSEQVHPLTLPSAVGLLRPGAIRGLNGAGAGAHSQHSDRKLGGWREMVFAGAQMLVM